MAQAMVERTRPGVLAPSASVSVIEPGRHLCISGRLDAATAHEIRRALDAAVAGGDGDLLVDVRDAEVHDSAGLGVLLGAARRAGLAGRQLVLLNRSERMERLLRAARRGRPRRPGA